MAKKAKSKINRKTKRIIRRSIAGLLMVTAIGIAAIPAREIEASPVVTQNAARTEAAATAAGRTAVSYNVAQPASAGASGTEDIDLSVKDSSNQDILEKASGDTEYTAYTIIKMSDNKYQIGWQFKYYNRNVLGSDKAIISQYNSTYSQKNVVLNSHAYTDYKWYTSDMYNDFYTTATDGGSPAVPKPNAQQPDGAKLYEITYNDYVTYINGGSSSKSDNATWLETNFPTEFNAYWNACKTYYEYQAYLAEKALYDNEKSQWDAWNAGDHSAPEPSVRPIPEPKPQGPEITEPLGKRPNQLPEESKYRYFCDNYKDPRDGNKTLTEMGYGSGFTLEPVYDDANLTASSGGTSTVVYMVSAAGTNNISGTVSKDDFGFLVTSASKPILGIAKRAFYDVHNVDVLTLPEEIKYIGDEAFMNSFIKEISFNNVDNVGNRAFKNCSQLKTVDLGSATSKIGTEAFYGTGVTSITFPYALSLLGPGAFAECQYLANVDFNSVDNADINKYAFYNDIALSNVNMVDSGIYHLGDGCFACPTGVTGSWINAVLPNRIKSTYTPVTGAIHDAADDGNGLGNWLFAGRSTLKSCTFPGNYGLSTQTTVPLCTFMGCSQLDHVEFPDQGNNSCGFVTFDKALFYDVLNADFYVRGPENKNDFTPALPRKATWKALTIVNDVVPYVYVNSAGVDCYEASDGKYLLQATAEGALTDCTLVDDTSTDPIDLIIPSYVGNYKITSLDSNCFDDDKLRNLIQTIVIEDDSISEISNDVFSGLPELVYVEIGDSVTKIGDKSFYDCPKLAEVVVGKGITSVGNQAFAKCPKLEDITFETPKNGYSSLTIGNEAFKTDSTKLTMHGDIVKGYALFDWTMNKENMIDDLGTRVCYQSLEPTFLRVIQDNNTGEVTLIDYPRFDELDVAHGPKTSGGDGHNQAMEEYYYKKYLDPIYDNLRDQFLNAWNDTAATSETRAALYDGNTYGPWISPYYIPSKTWNDSTPEAYFAKNPYSIIGNYKNPDPRGDYDNTTMQEEEWIEATINLVIPEGVENIDIYNYIKGEKASKNQQNVTKYIKDIVSPAVYKQYTDGSISDTSTDPPVDCVPGLFSGYYKDYATGSDDEKAFEKANRGNDCIESIVLKSVKYLPDYCFDSCEKLVVADIGPDCADIGTAPFRGCTEVTNTGNNDHFKCDNGIIYSVNDDGTYTIEECLPSRGNVVGGAQVSTEYDQYLPNVSAINEGAFEDCDSVSYIDLSDAEKLTEIPEKAFRNCDMLTTVDLPETVNTIKSKAFADDHPITVTIPGKEVHIATDAFDVNAKYKSSLTVRSYDDSAAKEYADYHGLTFKKIDDKYRVMFFDSYDGKQLGETQYVVKGGNATPPEEPKHDGWTFSNWSEPYINIEKDTFIHALYSNHGAGSVSGGDAGNNGSGSGGSGGSGSGSGGSGSGGSGSGGSSGDSTGNIHRVTVVNGSGTGDYLAGRTVTITANTSNGRTFSNWSSNDGVAFANSTSATTTFTMPDKNVTVTAYFTTSGSVSGNSSGANRNNAAGTTGTRVAINKPGISNTNLASAKVNGSTDDFIVKISETPEATAAVERALTNEYGSLDGLKYFAMDITLWDSNGATKITDTTGLSVDITIPLPDSLKDYAGNNKTAAVVNDYLEPLTPKFTTIDKVPCVTFRATHFSPYAIYVDTGNLSEGTRPDGTPKTADGIHPKWFLSIGLAALSLILFFKRDNKVRIKNI